MRKLALLLGIAIALTACNGGGDDDAPSLTLDVESVPASVLAGPSAYGENLYADYAGDSFMNYHDAETDLEFGVNDFEGEYNFWNGGVAVSRWNDTDTFSMENQCSVYANGGGYGNSPTFAAVYCSSYNPAPAVWFRTPETERRFESVWIANTTWTALAIENGTDFSRKLDYSNQDWLKLTVTGYDPSDNQTGSVEVYLADFRNSSSPGILDEWKYVNLTPLGMVHKLSFTITGSDTGQFGLNTPSYFCFDNLRFKL